MCIAILNIKKTLPKVYLQNSFDNNNQGAGLLYVKDNVLTTFKTYSKKDLIKEYFKVRKEINTPIVLHFRIATSGFSEHNLHPFLVNDNLGFVHNGVIWGLGNKDYSDTYQFNDMLKKLPKNFLNNHVIRELIANYIGGDKLVFLDSKNEWNIINEKNGHWFDGDWFSNNSYQQLNSFVYAGNKKVYKSKFIDDLWEDVEEEKQPETNEYLMELYGVNNEKDLQDEIEFEGFKDNNEAFDYYYKNY